MPRRNGRSPKPRLTKGAAGASQTTFAKPAGSVNDPAFSARPARPTKLPKTISDFCLTRIEHITNMVAACSRCGVARAGRLTRGQASMAMNALVSPTPDGISERQDAKNAKEKARGRSTVSGPSTSTEISTSFSLLAVRPWRSWRSWRLGVHFVLAQPSRLPESAVLSKAPG